MVFKCQFKKEGGVNNSPKNYPYGLCMTTTSLDLKMESRNYVLVSWILIASNRRDIAFKNFGPILKIFHKTKNSFEFNKFSFYFYFVQISKVQIDHCTPCSAEYILWAACDGRCLWLLVIALIFVRYNSTLILNSYKYYGSVGSYKVKYSTY